MALRCVLFCLVAGCSTALENTQTLNASQGCEEDTDTFLREIKQSSPKEYAVSMFDAFGKMGSNVKGGNANQPGLLQRCRSAHSPTFSGKYCQVFIRQETVQYFVGVCVPDSCGEQDVQTLALYGRLNFGQTSLIPPLPSLLVNQSTQEISMTHCLVNTIAPDASDVISVPLVATLLTAISRWRRNREVSAHEKSGLNNSTRHTPLCFPRSWVSQYLQAFSLQTTSQGVFSTSSPIPGGGYSSLNGIRALSLLWIISGHSAQFPAITNLDNVKDFKKSAASSPLHVFTISGPAYLAVDTFLLLGGLLSARSLLGSINRAEGRLSPSVVASYLFKRIKRIQPLHMFVMCLTISLVSLVHWGPYWFPFLEALTDCKKYWWANVLLISNLIPVNEICLPWTWYLSLDFQCYATTPLIKIAPLKCNCVVFVYRLSDTYNLFYYVKPHTRYGPFLIGIVTGTSKQIKCTIQITWHAALGWFCCLLLMAVLVILAYVLKETPSYPSVPHALYQGLHRPLWALALTWIILACEEGYGGFIGSFLSLGVWVPISNISFACYLIHPIFIILYIGLQETPIHYTDLNYMYMFLGHLVLTLLISYVLTVLIEKPYLLLKGNSA
uniref:Nose resistant-to-fluoxetine protein N-terminal domain-containing protein n=1 Tax=Anabas testudineus TaxID=64144 RepID=A0A3Q1IX09_ANATE